MLVRFSLLLWALCAVGLVDAQNYPITGVSVPAGQPVPYRKNINQLQKEGGPAWDLYNRALAEMYRESPSNRLSFFQIAGIHGKPYVQWNNAGPANTDGWRGYCPHGENLFLPWHRPYVMLFEQRLVEVATRLAGQYPSNVRARYQKAARELRSPYWDWASQQAIPTALAATRVRVNAPSGSSLQSVEIPNPLRYYNFPKAALDGQFGDFDSRPSIYKCRSPQSFPASANAALRGRSYKRWTYDALTRSTTFNEFSSTSNTGVSLEQIHNSIHWDASCGNQFVEAELSAFDPIFMLHHTNVDRLWAYWQAMRPAQASFSGSYRGNSRWQTRSGTTITPDSPLQPFYAAPGRFHTPRSVSSIRGKGYTYGALEYWRKSDAQMQKDATARINRLYGSGTSARMLKRDDSDEHEATRFFAQVEVELEELERPCSINAYVDDTMVGELVVLGQPLKGKWYGKFALDEAPDADPTLDVGKTVGTVVKDLLKTIRLEIVKHDGTSIPLESVSSLKVDLEDVKYIPPETVEEMPEYKDEQHREAPVEEFLGDSVATTFVKSVMPGSDD